MRNPHGYWISAYGEMITDGPRTSAYSRALKAAVSPDSIVADIGAGTGIFSLLACQSGATRVHAIEPSPTVEVARSIAAANGFASRMNVIQDVSTAIELDPAADVIVSDLHSILPLFEQHIPSIIDARSRLLAPAGQLIPRAETVWAALVQDAELSMKLEEPWLRNDFDLDMSAGHELVVNMFRQVHLGAGQLLVKPQLWAFLDYATIDNPNVANSMRWQMERVGTTHGLAVWFDAELDTENGFSNAPGEPELIYGQAFFPWSRPVLLEPGDTVDVGLRANLVNDDYIWSWTLDLRPRDGSDRPRVARSQSTFRSALTPPSVLRRREGGYRPVLSTDGEVDRYLLIAMDGGSALEDIARQAADEFPDHFSTWTEALARAGDLAVKYGT